jgi:hypothetical protein
LPGIKRRPARRDRKVYKCWLFLISAGHWVAALARFGAGGGQSRKGRGALVARGKIAAKPGENKVFSFLNNFSDSVQIFGNGFWAGF